MKTYFLQIASGPVKIGVAKHIGFRISQLSCGSPEEMKFLGSLDGNRERELHERFSADRIRGEWFRPSKGLMGFISERSVLTDPNDGDPRVKSPAKWVRFSPDAMLELGRIQEAESRSSFSNTVEKLVDEALAARRLKPRVVVNARGAVAAR